MPARPARRRTHRRRIGRDDGAHPGDRRGQGHRRPGRAGDLPRPRARSCSASPSSSRCCAGLRWQARPSTTRRSPRTRPWRRPRCWRAPRSSARSCASRCPTATWRSPSSGVAYPRGLTPARRCSSQYDVTDAVHVRVAGRSALTASAPLLAVIVVTWLLALPLARRMSAGSARARLFGRCSRCWSRPPARPPRGARCPRACRDRFRVFPARRQRCDDSVLRIVEHLTGRARRAGGRAGRRGHAVRGRARGPGAVPLSRRW